MAILAGVAFCAGALPVALTLGCIAGGLQLASTGEDGDTEQASPDANDPQETPPASDFLFTNLGSTTPKREREYNFSLRMDEKDELSSNNYLDSLLYTPQKSTPPEIPLFNYTNLHRFGRTQTAPTYEHILRPPPEPEIPLIFSDLQQRALDTARYSPITRQRHLYDEDLSSFIRRHQRPEVDEDADDNDEPDLSSAMRNDAYFARHNNTTR